MLEPATLESAKLGESSHGFGVYFVNGNFIIIVELTVAIKMLMVLVVLLAASLYLAMHKPDKPQYDAVPIEQQDEDPIPLAQEVVDPPPSCWVTSVIRGGKKARLVWASKSLKKYHTVCNCPGFNAAIKKEITCLMPCETAGCAFDNPI